MRGALGGLSLALLNLGELDEALTVSTEAADLMDRAGDAYNASYSRLGIGQIKLRRGDPAGARSDFLDVLGRFRSAGSNLGIALALDFIAIISLQGGEPERAARLGAFSDRLRRETGGGGSTLISNDEPPLDQARRLMDPAAFDRAVAEGEAFDLDQAVREATDGSA